MPVKNCFFGVSCTIGIIFRLPARKMDDEIRIKSAVKQSVAKYKKDNYESLVILNKKIDDVNSYKKDFKLRDAKNINYNMVYGLILELKDYLKNMKQHMYLCIFERLIDTILKMIGGIYRHLEDRDKFTCADANELRAHMNEIENHMTNGNGLLIHEHIFVTYSKVHLSGYKEVNDDRLNKYIKSHKELCIYSSLYKKLTDCWSHLFNEDEKQYIGLILADYNAKIGQFSENMDILNTVYFTDDRPADYDAVIAGLDLTPWVNN